MSDSDEESVYTSFKPGALVLGKMAGYPWWPAIIEDDPDYRRFFFLEQKNNKQMVCIHVSEIHIHLIFKW